ncbi:MAG TPA: helix-turn-helix transcriptional regulator [Acidimicrobiales bacterium]|nr:helix-turn-helix transcriptional regulator [Acidimicrobiales bacterium]
MSVRAVPPAAVALPGNYLHACLLLLLSESPDHGYDLAERLAGLGLTEVDTGTVYRALRRLREEGLVESEWEESAAGPARRRYWVTAAGDGALEASSTAVAATSLALRSFLERKRRLGVPAVPVAANG